MFTNLVLCLLSVTRDVYGAIKCLHMYVLLYIHTCAGTSVLFLNKCMGSPVVWLVLCNSSYKETENS